MINSYWIKLIKPIAVLLAKKISKLERIKPNHVTFIGYMSALIGILLFTLEDSNLVIRILIPVILVIMGVILDSVDGELARRKEISSHIGGWFDGMMDRILEVTIILVLYYETVDGDNIFNISYNWLTVIFFIAIILNLLGEYSFVLKEKMMMDFDVKIDQSVDEISGLIYHINNLINPGSIVRQVFLIFTMISGVNILYPLLIISYDGLIMSYNFGKSFIS